MKPDQLVNAAVPLGAVAFMMLFRPGHSKRKQHAVLVAWMQTIVRLILDLDQKVENFMTATKEQFAAALAYEGADIDTLATALAGLTNAIDALVANAPASPDFQPFVDAVAAHRAKLGAAIKGIQTDAYELS